MDKQVFLLLNGVAFRFPRSDKHGKKDTLLNIFLPEFAKQSSIQLPVFTSHTDERVGAYQIYDFIPGKQFLPKVARQFSQQEKLQIAKQIGTFLQTLHAYPISKAVAMGAYQINVKGYYDYFEDIWTKDRAIVYPLLTKDEKHYLDSVL